MFGHGFVGFGSLLSFLIFTNLTTEVLTLGVVEIVVDDGQLVENISSPPPTAEIVVDDGQLVENVLQRPPTAEIDVNDGQLVENVLQRPPIAEIVVDDGQLVENVLHPLPILTGNQGTIEEPSVTERHPLLVLETEQPISVQPRRPYLELGARPRIGQRRNGDSWSEVTPRRRPKLRGDPPSQSPNNSFKFSLPKPTTLLNVTLLEKFAAKMNLSQKIFDSLRRGYANSGVNQRLRQLLDTSNDFDSRTLRNAGLYAIQGGLTDFRVFADRFELYLASYFEFVSRGHNSPMCYRRLLSNEIDADSSDCGVDYSEIKEIASHAMDEAMIRNRRYRFQGSLDDCLKQLRKDSINTFPGFYSPASLAYHYFKHRIRDQSMKDYLNDAMNFFRENMYRATVIPSTNEIQIRAARAFLVLVMRSGTVYIKTFYTNSR